LTKIVLTVLLRGATILKEVSAEMMVKAGQVFPLASHAGASGRRMGIVSVGMARGRKGKLLGTRTARPSMTALVGSVNIAPEAGETKRVGCSMIGAGIANTIASVIISAIAVRVRKIRSGWIRDPKMKIKRAMLKPCTPWKNSNAGRRG
jgi:hypothetical protein